MTGLILDGRRIYADVAISKDEIVEKLKNKSAEKESKDKRNLFLAREGLIREGSLAAKGVSKFDMARRVQLEVRKKQMLRNLHFFVSKNRLVIHNLPPNIDDQHLRRLFLEAANHRSCQITEARVMKNLKQVDSNGRSPSKGFGFVTFTEHEHALAALRHLNNNPDLFTAKKRPIVEFSIENKSILNAKKRKEELSMKRRYDNTVPSKSHGQNNLSSAIPPKKKIKVDQPPTTSPGLSAQTKENFSGFISMKGIKGLPSHTGPKIRDRKKNNKKGFQEKTVKINTPTANRDTHQSNEMVKKQKPKNKKAVAEFQDDVAFQKLVNKYKKTVVDGRSSSKGKWFDE